MSRREQFRLRRLNHDLQQRLNARPFHHFVEDGGQMPAENVNVDKQRVELEDDRTGWLFMYINEADMKKSVEHEPDDPRTGQYASGAPLHHISGRGEQHPTPEVDDAGHVEQGVTDHQVRETEGDDLDADQAEKDQMQEVEDPDNLAPDTTDNVTGKPVMEVSGEQQEEITTDNTDGPTVADEPERETAASLNDPSEHEAEDDFDAAAVVEGTLDGDDGVKARIAKLETEKQLDAVLEADDRQGVKDAVEARRAELT